MTDPVSLAGPFSAVKLKPVWQLKMLIFFQVHPQSQITQIAVLTFVNDKRWAVNC